jgi:tetratricopeptide (TPR) repeat protein
MPTVRTNRGILRAFACSFSALAFSFAGNSALGADSVPSGPSGFEDLVRQGEAADAQFNPERALQFYLKASSERPKDPQVLLKIAKEYSDSTIAISDPIESRRRIEKALLYAKRAAELDPRSPLALLSQAICYGKLGEFCDTREKIQYARLVKDYADRALAIDPDYAYAHDVLGQWEFEVAALGRTKRFLVTLVFGGLPPASTQESVRHLERAVQLEPNTATHRLALGFAYLANGEPAKARRSFEQVMAMPCREIYDSDCHQQAERAIASL